MGNEAEAESPLPPPAVENPQHLRLDRNVEHRGGLVPDENVGLLPQGPGKRRPLGLAPGDLVRPAVEEVLGQPAFTSKRPDAILDR